MSDTTYTYQQASYFEQQHQQMLACIQRTVKRVLEVGCASGSFAAYLRSQRPVEVVAIEAHPAAAEAARPRANRLINASIEDAVPQLAGQSFDCVVFNDVLKHMVDPWAALCQIKPLLSDAGQVVASIPNIQYLPIFRALILRGHWEYQQQGLLDRIHLRFFSTRSMRQLFGSTGFTVQTLQGVNGIKFPWKLGVLNAFSGKRLQHTRFSQISCVALKSPSTAH